MVTAVEPIVFPEMVSCVPLMLTFAMLGFEFPDTYNAAPPVFVAVTLLEEPAFITSAFWLNVSAFAETTVGHVTALERAPAVPFRSAVTSVPLVMP